MKRSNIFLATPRLTILTLCCLSLTSCKNKAAETPSATTQPKAAEARKAPIWQSATELRYDVVKKLPHDPQAFLQGLEIHQGQWLESTGMQGASSIRRVNPATGKPLIIKQLQGSYFGEGLTVLNGLVYQLTWQHQTGFIYDAKTLDWKKNFSYAGEGWGLCNDGKSLFLSDGSSQIRVIDPSSMKTTRTLNVTWNGKNIDQLNELEYIEGEIFANIWRKDQILRIDPNSGKVIGVIDFTGIDRESPRRSVDHVLNGIAYDATTGLLYVTGKCWPHIYEVRLSPK
jgi:glutaminyl-peptide cyclotransferase